jgi:hypothetical protein
MPKWIWDIVENIVAYVVVVAVFAALVAVAGLVYALVTRKSPLENCQEILRLVCEPQRFVDRHDSTESQ